MPCLGAHHFTFWVPRERHLVSISDGSSILRCTTVRQHALFHPIIMAATLCCGVLWSASLCLSDYLHGGGIYPCHLIRLQYSGYRPGRLRHSIRTPTTLLVPTRDTVDVGHRLLSLAVADVVCGLGPGGRRYVHSMRLSLGAFTALPRPRVSRPPTAPQMHIVRAGPEIQGSPIKIRRRTDKFISGFLLGTREGYVHLPAVSPLWGPSHRPHAAKFVASSCGVEV